MTAFIYCDGEYINVNHIEKAIRTKGGKYQIVVDGKVVDDNNADFENAIVDAFQVQGEWEVLWRIAEDDGTSSYISEPVLGWGRTTLREIVAITPSESRGAEGNYALRKIGSNKVICRNSMTIFDGVADWLSQDV